MSVMKLDVDGAVRELAAIEKGISPPIGDFSNVIMDKKNDIIYEESESSSSN